MTNYLHYHMMYLLFWEIFLTKHLKGRSTHEHWNVELNYIFFARSQVRSINLFIFFWFFLANVFDFFLLTYFSLILYAKHQSSFFFLILPAKLKSIERKKIQIFILVFLVFFLYFYFGYLSKQKIVTRSH